MLTYFLILIKVKNIFTSKSLILFLLMLILLVMNCTGEFLLLSNIKPFITSFMLSEGEHGRDKSSYMPFNFISIVLFATFTRISFLWLGGKFTTYITVALSDLAFKTYLLQGYNRTPLYKLGEIQSYIVNKVTIAGSVIYSVILLFANILLTCTILISLVLQMPYITIIGVISIGLVYNIIYLATLKTLSRNSANIKKNSDSVSAQVSALTTLIPEATIFGIQESLSEDLRFANNGWRSSSFSNTFHATYPRYAVEAVGYIIIACAAVFSRDSADILSTISPLVVGIQRMLPAMQQVHASRSTIRGYKQVLFEIFDIALNSIDFRIKMENFTERASIYARDVLSYSKFVAVSAVNLKFTGLQEDKHAEGLDLDFQPCSLNVISGASGSGKTSLLAVLSGLHPPESGKVLYNHLDIYGFFNSKLLQNSLASYCSQSPSLFHGSIFRNITFLRGSDSKVDFSRLHEALLLSFSLDFVKSLPNGIHSVPGYDCATLSGGQIQRISLARSFYHNRDVMFFDEPTSSLDIETSTGILESLIKLKSSSTIICVSHSEELMQAADRHICI